MALSRTVRSAAARLSREARFVFTGVVEREGSSSLSAVPAGPQTAVVRVERIHRGASALHDQVNQVVTVIFSDDSQPGDDGRRWVFFTNPILYGETVGVREIGQLETPDDLDALHELVTTMSDQEGERELSEHLAAADVVVTGEVTALHRASAEGEVPRSEHDPDWWIADIRLGELLKGGIDSNELAIRYPRSRDVRWYRVPKPQEGDEALFILHRDGQVIGNAALAILHPGDAIPAVAENRERVRRLV